MTSLKANCFEFPIHQAILCNLACYSNRVFRFARQFAYRGCKMTWNTYMVISVCELNDLTYACFKFFYCIKALMGIIVKVHIKGAKNKGVYWNLFMIYLFCELHKVKVINLIAYINMQLRKPQLYNRCFMGNCWNNMSISHFPFPGL